MWHLPFYIGIIAHNTESKDVKEKMEGGSRERVVGRENMWTFKAWWLPLFENIKISYTIKENYTHFPFSSKCFLSHIFPFSSAEKKAFQEWVLRLWPPKMAKYADWHQMYTIVQRSGTQGLHAVITGPSKKEMQRALPSEQFYFGSCMRPVQHLKLFSKKSSILQCSWMIRLDTSATEI